MNLLRLFSSSLYSNGDSPQEQNEEQREKNERRWMIAILIVALLLRVAFALALPAWASPDEYPHYWVVDYIAQTGSLPHSRPEFPRYEAFQPPLYYGIAAGVLQLSGLRGETPAFDDAGIASPPASLILLRLFAALLGLLTLFVVWQTVRGIPNLTSTIRLGTLSFVAFLPTYIGITSSVNNDALVILLAAIAIYFCLKGSPSRRDILFAGGAAGLALLTKMNGIIVLPVLLLPVLRAYQHSRKRFLSTTLLLFLGSLLGAGLLLARNLFQYNSLTAVMPGLDRQFAIDPANLLHAVRNLFWSFWAAFGRTYQIHPPTIFYFIFFLPLLLVAAIGWIRRFRFYKTILLLTFLSVGFGLLLSLAFTLSYPAGTMTSWGKNLYPLLPLIALAFAVGWQHVTAKRSPLFTGIGTAVLVGFSLWSLLGFL